MKIEKNIPMALRSFSTQLGTIAQEMEIGDSVFFPFTKHRTATSLREALRRMGRKGCVMRVKDGYRIWRVETKADKLKFEQEIAKIQMEELQKRGNRQI